MTLAKSAMLVSVTIINGGLLGERKDRKASELVENTYNVSHKRAKASKYLIDRQSKPVKNVVAAAQRLRQKVNHFTLPWADGAARLLPVKLHEQFGYAIKRAQDELEDARADYIRAYPNLVTASKQELADLFDPSQYPGADQIRELFKTKVTYWPIPESGHFVADIAREAAEEAKAQIEEEIDDRLIEATYDIVRRAKEVVEIFLDKLEKTDTSFDKDKNDTVLDGVIRDAITDNVKDTAKLIEAMNITGNPQVEKVVRDLKRLHYNAWQWRRNPYVYSKERPEAISIAKEVMVNLQMLDLRDQQITDMVTDAREYLE